MHASRLALATSVLALAAASPAWAARATFNASIAGTYTQHGTVTDTRCYTTNDNDDVTYFTKSAAASENDSFRSVKPIKLVVSRMRGDRTFLAGSFSNLKTRFTLNRTSEMDGTDTPRDCRPSGFDPSPSDCGTKTVTFPLRVYGRQDHAGFSYLFTRHFSTFYPDDPFHNCPLAGGTWPGQLQQNGVGPVKISKLFRRGVKKIVVHGGVSDSKHENDGDVTSDSSYTLSWTLTLRRR